MNILFRCVSPRPAKVYKRAFHSSSYVLFYTTAAIFFLFLTVLTLQGNAQTSGTAEASDALKKEQASFLDYIRSVPVDANIVARLNRFISIEVDSIHKGVIKDSLVPDPDKAKAIRSLKYLIQELCQPLSLQKIEIYNIPEALECYKKLLAALLYHTEYKDLLIPLGPAQSQLLAAVFWQYQESELLTDIAIYKRVVSSPEFILLFLEIHPGYRFADSLLQYTVNYNPLKIVNTLQQDEPVLDELFHKNQNIYVQQFVRLSSDPNASTLVPFIIQLAEKRMAIEDILEKRRESASYFQLLVNTLQKEKAGSSDSVPILTPLRKAIKEKSISFYVNQINELHAAPDNIRFASVKELRIQDIYYIITSCEEELYTSSYLGLYSRLMKHFSTPSADSLFRLLQYDNFPQFIRMAANYNTLADFLSCMPRETSIGLLKRFMSGIERDTHTGLEKAMDVADSYAGFSAIPGYTTLIGDELRANFERCRSGQSYFGMRLYSILLKVYDQVNQDTSLKKSWSSLGNYDILENKALQNKKGEIIQLILFYGDEDGIASYNNFIKRFNDAGKWNITKNRFWVTIHSVSEQPIIIYANLPLDNYLKLDLEAQDSLITYLKQRSEDPVILIHRGHSYHLDETMKRMQPSVKLAILGSCGGSNNIISIANISPDAQIIVSKKMGSMLINDPILELINETLYDHNDLIWTEVWGKLRNRFRSDEFALNLFNEYIPPSKNVSLFVLKLFNFFP